MCARRGAQRGGEKVPTLGRVADSKEGLFKIGGVIHLKDSRDGGLGQPLWCDLFVGGGLVR